MRGMKERAFRTAGLAALLFAFLLLAGGGIGFALKGSLPSLVMGGSCGFLLIYLSMKILTRRLWGLIGATSLLLCLEGVFTLRLMASHRLFPAGALLLLTTTTLYLVARSLKRVSVASDKIRGKLE